MACGAACAIPVLGGVLGGLSGLFKKKKKKCGIQAQGATQLQLLQQQVAMLSSLVGQARGRSGCCCSSNCSPGFGAGQAAGTSSSVVVALAANVRSFAG